MDRILVLILIALFMIMIVIAGWTILAQRRLAKYLPFLLVVYFMSAPVMAQEENFSIQVSDAKPIILEPQSVSTASDLLWEELAVLLGHEIFLENDSLNITAINGSLFYA